MRIRSKAGKDTNSYVSIPKFSGMTSGVKNLDLGDITGMYTSTKPMIGPMIASKSPQTAQKIRRAAAVLKRCRCFLASGGGSSGSSEYCGHKID